MLMGLSDVHVDMRITNGLRRRGMDIATSQDLGADRMDDEALLAVALSQLRVLLTNDNDFQEIAAKLQTRGEPFAPIFYWPQAKRGIGQIIDAVFTVATQRTYEDSCSLLFYF